MYLVTQFLVFVDRYFYLQKKLSLSCLNILTMFMLHELSHTVVLNNNMSMIHLIPHQPNEKWSLLFLLHDIEPTWKKKLKYLTNSSI